MSAPPIVRALLVHLRTSQARKPRGGGALLCAIVGLTAAASSPACFARGYPLSESGVVDIRLDSTSALFAADALDASGRPIGPRQRPTATGVTLSLTEDGEPANGGFVHVRVSPPEALVLRPATDELGDVPTCEHRDGSFRCIASPEGVARFVVDSQSDWSGSAKIFVGWAGQELAADVAVAPAGLPEDASNFSLIVSGVDDASRVLPTFRALQCSVDVVPEDLGSKWRTGEIRSFEAFVRATAPTNAPTVVENAPVIIESLSSEGALSLEESCEQRETRLRLLLGPTGQSEKFFLCFSDLGGAVEFTALSGRKSLTKALAVDPEPRILRVLARASEVPVDAPVHLFEVSAFNADRVRLSMPVDLRISDDDVMTIGENLTTTLSADGEATTLVQVLPKKVGSAHLTVTPRLLSAPACSSPPVDVVAAQPEQGF